MEQVGKMNNTKKTYQLRYKGIEFLKASFWQRSSPQHPGGTGKQGYRVIYKTLKLIPIPTINLSVANLRVRMVVEKVEAGGVRVKGETFPTLYPNNLLLPEQIEIERDGKTITFHGKTNMHWHFEPYEEELPMYGIVELFLEMDEENEDNFLSEGRRRISPILAILDLVFGERLIGSLITEEIVELFPDGHWNRKVISPLVGSESQLDMMKIEVSQIEQMKISVEALGKLGDVEWKKVALAADWFWKSERKSERKSDAIDKFIELWICLEALEMSDTDIKPISEKLATITTENYDFWKKPIGRLFGKRSDLVHGKSNEIEKNEVVILRGIVKILLANTLGKVEDPDLVQEIISLIKLHFK
jgi:hypothetical protein